MILLTNISLVFFLLQSPSLILLQPDLLVLTHAQHILASGPLHLPFPCLISSLLWFTPLLHSGLRSNINLTSYLSPPSIKWLLPTPSALPYFISLFNTYHYWTQLQKRKINKNIYLFTIQLPNLECKSPWKHKYMLFTAISQNLRLLPGRRKTCSNIWWIN